MSRRAKLGIMIALFALAVGFAAVTTTLVINGTLSIGPDGEGFDRDIVFSKAKISSGKGNAFIASDGKSLNFTAELMELGKEVSLRYDITNKNRQYDAAGSVSCDFVDETNAYNGYITIEEVPEEFSVNGGTKTTGYVNVRLVRSFAGDETVDAANVEFKCVIKLEAEEREDLAPELPPVYTDAELNGADPVINGGLVPISLTNDGKVIYADMYNKWYDYSTRRWANAVLLAEGKDALYDEGDVIKEEDIVAYFVWVPRFRYKLWNADQTDDFTQTDQKPAEFTDQATTIDVVFETKDVEPSMGTQNGEWLTHPAFTAFDVNGIWVAKFETGYNGATSTMDAQVNTSSTANIIIKPNAYSWRSASLYNMFKASYDYNRALESHMMKNTEWGAVSYLTHSQYGIDADLRINNNNAYLTGYAAVEAPTCKGTGVCNKVGNDLETTQPYNTATGYLASTTGNITGIYDMSGGANEYVAAYMEGKISASGFSTQNLTKYEKYLDKYVNGTKEFNYSNRILGDATGEMGPFFYYKDKDGNTRYHSVWHENFSHFIFLTNSWFFRGGAYDYGSIAGQFAFSAKDGNMYSNFGSRIVLAI